MIEWLNTNAGAVQALAAVGTFILTVVLAAATVWYAKSAKDQIDELQIARTAAVEPYVRAAPMRLNIGFEDSGGRWPEPQRVMTFTVRLTNLGLGPAIDIRAWLDVPVGIQLTSVGPSNLASGQTQELIVHVSPTHLEALVSQFPLQTTFRVGYGDLLNRWWLTTAEVTLGWVGPATEGSVAAMYWPSAEHRELVSAPPDLPRPDPSHARS